MKSEKEIKAIADALFKEHQEFISKLSPEEKEKLRRDSEETKNLLEHCKVQTEYGLNYKANKIDIGKFLFLQKKALRPMI